MEAASEKLKAYFSDYNFSHSIWKCLASDQTLATAVTPNPCHSSNPSHCSDKAGSLTYCITRERLTAVIISIVREVTSPLLMDTFAPFRNKLDYLEALLFLI